ncbi:MAG: Gfo/Idh/MocA family oxidoreductase [Clostridia bacterium]|nr:Gfo/Idh/MocA family oxidoreductase [Clostridia bacterium]
MEQKKFRIGIIGCGGIANGKHMPSLKALSSECEMVAFCDLIIGRAEKAKADFGTPDAKVYTDYRELLKDETIDVVHVCTPNKSHAPISIAALEAGKNVMCEKPMAKTAAEAKQMLEAAKRTGKTLTIGYQNRQATNMQLVKKMAEDGVFGKIYYGKALALRRRAVPTWGVFLNEEEQGGGPLIDIGTHALDLTLWTMNNYEVESVTGNVHYELRGRENAANAWGPWDPAKYTVEDSAFGFIKMKNGATIILESSWAINLADTREAQYVLAGTEAGVDFVDGVRINGEEYSRLYTKNVDLKKGGVAFYDGSAGDSPALAEARQWLKSLREGTAPCVLPEQALVVSQILEAIYESYKTGKTIYFN